MGDHRAGFDVVGVDIKPQPHYPFKSIHADAFALEDAIRANVPGFEAIHASPPCQRWLGVPGALGEEYPDLLTPVREILCEMGLPYVSESTLCQLYGPG
jgi:DNA (cytosine-5)-methyltransferase 1